MTEFNVYLDRKTNCLFSEGITRSFGKNKCVKGMDESFLASVQPLLVDPEEFGLELIGTITEE